MGKDLSLIKMKRVRRFFKVPAFMLPMVCMFLMISGLMMLWMIRWQGGSSQRINSLRIKNELWKELHLQREKVLSFGPGFKDPDLQYSHNDGITVFREISHHGLYPKAFLKVQSGCFSDSMEFLIGRSIDRDALFGLVVKDQGDPLILSGNVRIGGRSFLPRKGILRSQRSGYPIPKEECIIGIIEDEFDWELLTERFQSIESDWRETPHDFISLFTPNSDRTYENELIFCERAVIPSWFSGSIQVIAKTSVSVEGGAKLDYPSGLAITGKGRIQVENGCHLQGIIYCGAKSTLFLDRDVQVLGEVYALGEADIRGMVKGGRDASGTKMSPLPSTGVLLSPHFSHDQSRSSP